MKASDIRRGHVLLVDGAPCRVLEFQHRTPGNLRAFVQVRLRDLLSGKSFDRRFGATETVEEVRVETRELQALYHDGLGLHAMDTSTYEESVLDDETVGDLAGWLGPGTIFSVEWLGGRPIGVEPPASVEAEVVETAPSLRGATRTAGTKPARLGGGQTVQVPEFIGVGDRIRVRPIDGSYLERA
jgi:elongation factor P